MSKKKVLFFLPGTVGGAERMTVTIAKMLPLDKYEVKFVIVDRQKGNIVNFIPNEYEVLFLKIRNIWDFTTIRMHRLLKRESPDIAFCSLMYLNYRLLLASISMNVRVIIRNNNELSELRGYEKPLLKYTYKHADAIIAQQNEMKEELVRVLSLNPDKIYSLQNPIDTKTVDEKAKAESPYPIDDSVNYVWVGRFSKEKGQDVLAKAFAVFYKENPKAHLYFVGKYDADSEFFKGIQSTINENKMQENVHFVGYDSNPYRWVKHCDCFVLPSRLEGLPNSLLEAMYLGRPVVAATCIPVIERMVDEGVNGYKVKSEDYVAMAEAMKKAVLLKNCKLSFRSATEEDFIKLF